MDASSSDEFEVEDVSQAKQKGLPFSKKQSEVLESFRGMTGWGKAHLSGIEMALSSTGLALQVLYFLPFFIS